MEIINDQAMRETMHADLKDHFGMNNIEAKKFIDENVE